MYISSAFFDKQQVTIVELLERVIVLYEFNVCGHVKGDSSVLKRHSSQYHEEFM